MRHDYDIAGVIVLQDVPEGGYSPILDIVKVLRVVSSLVAEEIAAPPLISSPLPSRRNRPRRERAGSMRLAMPSMRWVMESMQPVKV